MIVTSLLQVLGVQEVHVMGWEFTWKVGTQTHW